MIVRQAAPDPRLGGIVSRYHSRTAEAGFAARRIALPARTDVLLEFYFTAPHLLELQVTGVRERAPRVAAVGPQTFRRVDLILSGRMDIFTIRFTPTGLHALLGVPMAELTDAGIDGAALFGTQAMADWHERLAGAAGLDARARIADAFLLDRLAEPRKAAPTPAMAMAVAHLRRTAGAAPTTALARTAGRSERQFRRLFEEQVGMAPKLYARIVRLEAAIAAKAASPDTRWTDIAHAVGWFDQAHMDKDFRALTGVPPSRFALPAPR